MPLRSYFGPFPKPTQHGAWAMFLLPAAMVVVVLDKWSRSSFLLIISFILIFLSHRPAVRFLRRWKRRRTVDRHAYRWALLLGGSGIALASFLFLSQQQWNTLFFGFAVAVSFLLHLRLTLDREHMSATGEIIGVLGLTASAPVMYLFLNGALDAKGWVLWMISFLYFAGSIFYVKLKVRTQPSFPEPDLGGKLRAGMPVVLYGALVLIYLYIITVIRGYSWFFFWAYVPFLVKGSVGVFRWQSKETLKVNRLGLLELAHSILFAVLSLVGFARTIA
ncbi:MAG: YwiC-like family protein [Candidatus Marinimicrobia bacterium]|nr:hypothetical protein [Candidatus Neomarinimicrobiota bacterium]MDP6456803.1 YwiC-like family protein [Candidatus Neomarinimicrobiota bacterium]MDP6593542.1 YwiC-like family protein [Candidatus Neomarinimicrobiota bacterium]MDP6837223.1 YwiC-like family protein [Candidatus Neomarinimicrobiota bacterium]MDP6967038.1 YwiC-like family protein [Candidatus Neomarinimicrobiota bacterium]